MPQIIAAVLEQHGILADAYTFELGPVVYPPRTFCVQYAETDLHFIQRLCEEEGIHYHFRHSADAHVLVLGDDQTVFRRLPAQRYCPAGGPAAETLVIQRFDVRLATRSAQVVRRDYDFEHPSLRLQEQAGSFPALEDYQYPAGFTGHLRGSQLARRGLERHQRDRHRALGRSDQPALRSGHFLELRGHPDRTCNDLWLITGVRHEGYQPQVLEEAVVDSHRPSRQRSHTGQKSASSLLASSMTAPWITETFGPSAANADAAATSPGPTGLAVRVPSGTPPNVIGRLLKIPPA